VVQKSSSNPPAHSDDDRTVITDLRQVVAPRSESRSKAYLTIIGGPQTGEMFPIEKQTVILGRGEECDLRVRDSGISRVHAKVERQLDGSFDLDDMNSTNGVFVGGVRIQNYRLSDGDRVQIGAATVIKFSLQDDVEITFQQQLYQSAVRDGLTQVYNRQFFEERLHHEFSYAFRHTTAISLLMVDIDFFKKVNDTYGHPTGDLVLKVIACTIQRIIRNEDILCRYGGEEFVVIARGTDYINTGALAERIRRAIEELSIPITSGDIKITVSVGWATMSKGEYRSPKELLSASDKALYLAKQGGRNLAMGAAA